MSPEKKRNGFATLIERCPPTAQALILLAMFAGAGLSVGLLFDDLMGVPGRIEENSAMIADQDTAHRAIMRQADSVTGDFRDSILNVQSNILRTLRALLCFESARLEDRSTAPCGLRQLLEPIP